MPFENKPHMLYCPPPDSGILAKDWKNFVMSRLSIKFQKASEEQKERQRKNIYPHHVSHRGYAGLREIMMDELTGMMKWIEQCCGSEHVQIKIGSLRVNF